MQDTPTTRVVHSTQENNEENEWLGADDEPLPAGWLVFADWGAGEGDPSGPFDTEKEAAAFAAGL